MTRHKLWTNQKLVCSFDHLTTRQITLTAVFSIYDTTMAESRGVDSSVGKELWFKNMQLLEFDFSEAEKQCGFPFESNMFDQPNKYGYVIVLKFLFSCLNKKRCTENFRFYHSHMESKDEVEFRKISQKWLEEISKENPEFGFPLNIPSLLLRRSGYKFYELLFAFSHYVLYERIRKETELVDELVSPPSAVTRLSSAPFYDCSSKVTESLSHRYMAETKSLQSKFEIHKSEVEAIAKRQMTSYYQYLKNLPILEDELKELLFQMNLNRAPLEVLLAGGLSNKEWIYYFDKQQQAYNHLVEELTKGDEILQQFQNGWGVCEFALEDDRTKCSLNDSEQMKQMEILLQREPDSSDSVCLSSVINLFNDHLTNMLLLMKEKMPNLLPFCDRSSLHQMKNEHFKKSTQELIYSIEQFEQEMCQYLNEAKCPSPKKRFSQQLMEPSPQLQELRNRNDIANLTIPSTPKSMPRKAFTPTDVADMSYNQMKRLAAGNSSKIEETLSPQWETLDTSRIPDILLPASPHLAITERFKSYGNVEPNRSAMKPNKLFPDTLEDVNTEMYQTSKFDHVTTRKQQRFNAAEEFRFDLLTSPLVPSTTPMFESTINLLDSSPSPVYPARLRKLITKDPLATLK